ncbi:darcynin family protein [Paucibacter sp. APW11]|uniref:Darcynin family protein n=1 Tax=Roseateles aquae TaxID=3077235 RepID=A0ABU3PC88_9BURK|nr:darcynin family protein [Paucibacter sp. APW11]MDT9000153.1 darcynin family protein [Paucibacter sp. APW11]
MNCCFLLVNALPAWLRLPREQRAHIFETEVLSLLPRYPGLKLRHFDCEAYSAVCSDVLMLEVPDAKTLHFFIEGLRDSSIHTVPYFEVRHVLPAWEDGFRAYEAQGELAST